MRRFFVAAVMISVACADEIPEDVSSEMARAARANVADTSAVVGPELSELVMTAPPGGHADWIRDIRMGLDSVPAEAELDRGEALYSVQELYSRRFEPLQEFYGAGGAAMPEPALAEAVEAAGNRLQDIMRLLASDSDAAQLEAALRDAQQALDDAQAAAQRAGLPGTAPRDTVPGSIE